MSLVLLRPNYLWYRRRTLALTAHALEADKERALAAGADDFDTKPVNLSGLLEKIEALLLD